ncbi:MAG: lycopene beta-cyclase [Pelagibacterales bacterium]|nr:lycopene beta-cyclase [Pelagibacterales bacterium]
MKEFDYVIIGGGCAGLSLAYELELHKKLLDKTLAIIEPRKEYKRDKTWSFWKVYDHNFQDCVIKSWNNFSINTSETSLELRSEKYPYQSIDSEKFYNKIIAKLSLNNKIQFFKNINEINTANSIVFNSVYKKNSYESKLWQHFQGIEIETDKNTFDDQILNLMDFNCEQKDAVHFFYTLPFTKNKALIETTWLSNLKNESYMNYDLQLKDYIKNNLGIKNYKVNFTEKGSIPLFYPSSDLSDKKINIGSVGGMTRLSTGYTFLNIQEHSKYIRINLDDIKNKKLYHIGKKYEFLDNIFLNVLKNNPSKMQNIFLKMFKGSSAIVIKFLSNKSNFFEDILIILKMPKWIFIKALFRND